MAKKAQASKAKRGRPRKVDGLGARVLVRMTDEQKEALKRYADDIGAGGESAALRIIMIEKLKAGGLLK